MCLPEASSSMTSNLGYGPEHHWVVSRSSNGSVLWPVVSQIMHYGSSAVDNCFVSWSTWIVGWGHKLDIRFHCWGLLEFGGISSPLEILGISIAGQQFKTLQSSTGAAAYTTIKPLNSYANTDFPYCFNHIKLSILNLCILLIIGLQIQYLLLLCFIWIARTERLESWVESMWMKDLATCQVSIGKINQTLKDMLPTLIQHQRLVTWVLRCSYTCTPLIQAGFSTWNGDQHVINVCLFLFLVDGGQLKLVTDLKWSPPAKNKKRQTLIMCWSGVFHTNNQF